MTREFVDLYKYASDALIAAMQEVIQLIDIDGEMFKLDMLLLRVMRDPVQKQDTGKSTALYNEKLAVMHRRSESVRVINSSLVSSIKGLIKMIDVAFGDPTLVQEIALCQKQTDAIINFINKDYVIKDVDISGVKQLLLVNIYKYTRKEQLPQFVKIIDQLLKLYNISVKADIEMNNP